MLRSRCSRILASSLREADDSVEGRDTSSLLLVAMLVVVEIFGRLSVRRISSPLVISLILIPSGLLLAAGMTILADVVLSVVTVVVVLTGAALLEIGIAFGCSISSRSSASSPVSFDSALDSSLGEAVSAILKVS